MAEELLDRASVLQDAISGRKNEIMMYDINIVNYEAVIEEMIGQYDGQTPEDADMRDYRTRITELIRSEKREKAKSQLLLNALEKQLAALQG